MENKIVIIASHATFTRNGKYVYGIGSTIGDFLKDKEIKYFFIKHPLFGGAPSLIESYVKGIVSRERLDFNNSVFLPLRALQELKITFRVLNEIKKPINLFIGIDPLNAFYGLLAKRLGKIERVIFYTADYAIKRFNNPLTNWIYHWFDKCAIKKADEVWNVSTRITELRRRQGVQENKNFFVPNSPEFNKIKRLDFNKINKHDLVCVSNFTDAIDFSLTIRAIKKLSERYPDIKLLLIGGGKIQKELEELTKKLNIKKNVLFLGRMEHKKVLEILPHCAVGIALYTEECAWTKFGDSIKIREYLAYGLPIIMTGIPSTADDIKRAQVGYVVKLEEEEFTKAIEEMFDNEEKYKELKNNAINLAQKFDITKILERLLIESM